MKVKVRLFGAFRDYDESGELEFELQAGATAAQLRAELALVVGRPELLAESVLADENSVLSENHVLREAAVVAVLPPVCGG